MNKELLSWRKSFLDLFTKEKLLSKSRFRELIEKSPFFLLQYEKFEENIHRAKKRYDTLLSELQNIAWEDYNIIVDNPETERLINKIKNNQVFQDHPYLISLFFTSELYNKDFISKNANLLQIGDRSGKIDQLDCFCTELTLKIANTEVSEAITLIESGVDINKYVLDFGNNPLLLSIIKGWGHHQNCVPGNPSQKEIILRLLACPLIEVNKPHLFNGMSAMHIACLRGDPLDVIECLLDKGADLTLLDYDGKNPIDYLDMTYEDAMNLYNKLAANELGGKISETWCTVPNAEERENNVNAIKEYVISRDNYTNMKSIY